MSARAVVVGVGNRFRGDDAVGLAVAERLRALVPPGVAIAACEEEPSRLLESWRGADAALVVDGVASGGDPGSLHRYDAADGPLPARTFRSSTHSFGIGEAIELSRALGTLPPRVVVYGIEVAVVAAGEGLTAPVEAAVATAADAMLADLRVLAGEEGSCTSRR